MRQKPNKENGSWFIMIVCLRNIILEHKTKTGTKLPHINFKLFLNVLKTRKDINSVLSPMTQPLLFLRATLLLCNSSPKYPDQ